MSASELSERADGTPTRASETRLASQPTASAATGKRREDAIVGASEATRRLIAQATAAARSDMPVWLTGPPGSDRDGAARAIHAWGPRARAEFSLLVCSAMPEALQERSLVGCAAGHYPAIPGTHVGALERAAGGTIFIDGVEALRPAVRDMLLHAVSLRRFRREGESGDRALAARVVLGSDGAPTSPFMQVPHHEIRLTPLAERREDVLALAAHYLRTFSDEAGARAVGFTADARDALLEEAWSGDALELRARIREAVRLNGDGAITAEALLLARDKAPSFKEAKRAFERRYVSVLLRRCDGNISRAARLARKDRKDFYDVLRRTGLDPSQFRD
ncbi:MAG: sigma-54-dependent Fis family transcriptional regulator [Deltaproteobacteria bacterium]|nr:sigma-54-dependent Fis family transcriptional regulator [Deltaproteobacteria bacterium]